MAVVVRIFLQSFRWDRYTMHSSKKQIHVDKVTRPQFVIKRSSPTFKGA